MPLPIDWPERARRVLTEGARDSELTAGDLASQLESALVASHAGPHRERLSLLIEYVVASEGESFSAERARGALLCAANTKRGHHNASDIVPGWDPDLRVLFDVLAIRAPALLQDVRDSFSEAAQQQIDFARALAGQSDWPRRAMVGVARRYLNCPPKTFAYENRIPVTVLSDAIRTLLKEEAVPLLQWSRIEPLLPRADDELRALFIINYCAQDFRSRAFQLADASSPAMADLLQTALAERKLSFSGAIASALLLTRARGSSWTTAIPPKVHQALLWDLRCGSDVEATVSLQAYSCLPGAVAGELLRECLREERAVALIPAVPDDQVIDDLLQRIKDSGSVSDTAIDALVACGSRAVAPLLAACAAKSVHSVIATVAAEVLSRSDHPDKASVLVGILGHSSKRASGAAAHALERLGESARADLQAGTLSSKKSVRAHCQRLLARLGQQSTDETTPLSAVRAATAALAIAEREAFLSLWDEAGQSEAAWQAQLRPEVRRLGAVALELLRQWFIHKLEEGETRLWCYAVEELKEDPQAVWVAVDSFARMPKLSASLWARPRRALSHCGALLCDPIIHCLRNVHTEYREALYGLLATHADGTGVDVFLTGLSAPSKTVRTHCVDGLSRLSNCPLKDVASLLSGSEIGARVAAAELLAVWGQSDVADLVADAFRLERSSKVQPYLEDALIACGRTELVFELDQGAELDEDAVERFLSREQLPKKLPGFISRDEMPELRFVSGRPLSEAARRGFLARLMMLDLTLKGRVLRATLPLLVRADTAAFARWVYEGWARARNSKHKWAILQLSLLADEELLTQALSQVGTFRGTEHTAINCHLRAAQWHPSNAAVHWLGYWSENLSSLGARATAKQLLTRVAFKRKCSVEVLRNQLIPFLAEERAEGQLIEEAAPGYPQQRQLEELERTWLTGRSWRGPLLIQLLLTQRYLRGQSLLFRNESNELVRFATAAASQATGQFVDERDRPVPNEQLFSLAHPVDTSAQEIATWKQRLEPDAPLAQLERPVFDLEQLEDCFGSMVPVDAFSRFRRRNRWFHGEAMDAGIVYTDSLHLLGRGRVLTLHHSGYGIGTVDFDDEVKLLGLECSDLDGRRFPLSSLSSIVVSEICYGLTQLTSDG